MAGYYSVQEQSVQRSNHVLSYPERSQATTVFVLGLCGMLVFPLLAPFAWSMGTRELQAIEAGRRAPDNRQMARIGRILGIAMSLLLILFVALVFGLILVSL